MNNLWKGIAIVGIWIGVSLIGLSDPGARVAASMFAMLATLFVVAAD